MFDVGFWEKLVPQRIKGNKSLARYLERIKGKKDIWCQMDVP
jgi:hypothetical protein